MSVFLSVHRGYGRGYPAQDKARTRHPIPSTYPQDQDRVPPALHPPHLPTPSQDQDRVPPPCSPARTRTGYPLPCPCPTLPPPHPNWPGPGQSTPTPASPPGQDQDRVPPSPQPASVQGIPTLPCPQLGTGEGTPCPTPDPTPRQEMPRTGYSTGATPILFAFSRRRAFSFNLKFCNSSWPINSDKETLKEENLKCIQK